MKVLHIINNLDKGGAERLLVEVLPLYGAFDIEIRLLQLSARKSASSYVRLLEESGIKCESLGTSSVYNPSLIWRLRRYLKANTFSVVHVHLFPSMYFVPLASLGFERNSFKLIFTEHSTQNRRLKSRLLRKLDRWVYNRYNRIIAISDEIAANMANSYALHDKITVIQNGVNVDRVNITQPLQRSQIMQELNIPISAKLLFMAARFAYPKDHITPIEALSLLPASYHLIYAGEGQNLPLIRSHIKKRGLSGRVHLIGFRNDVLNWMKSVDVNLLSSHYEGLSGVTLEALASQVAFLGSDVSGINNVVPDQRFLFERQSSQDLARKIERITLDATYRERILFDSAVFIKKFDIKYMALEHAKLYKDLYEETRKG